MKTPRQTLKICRGYLFAFCVSIFSLTDSRGRLSLQCTFQHPYEKQAFGSFFIVLSTQFDKSVCSLLRKFHLQHAITHLRRHIRVGSKRHSARFFAREHKYVRSFVRHFTENKRIFFTAVFDVKACEASAGRLFANGSNVTLRKYRAVFFEKCDRFFQLFGAFIGQKLNFHPEKRIGKHHGSEKIFRIIAPRCKFILLIIAFSIQFGVNKLKLKTRSRNIFRQKPEIFQGSVGEIRSRFGVAIFHEDRAILSAIHIIDAVGSCYVELHRHIIAKGINGSQILQKTVSVQIAFDPIHIQLKKRMPQFSYAFLRIAISRSMKAK